MCIRGSGGSIPHQKANHVPNTPHINLSSISDPLREFERLPYELTDQDGASRISLGEHRNHAGSADRP